jgi:lipid II:glycine glycyltransferase (peptidoglycan interpeptide bridge formation enzyme)
MMAHQSFAAGWNRLTATFPQAHVLQTWEWAQFKSAYSWQPHFLAWESAPSGAKFKRLFPENQLLGLDTWRAAALVLQRRLRIAGLALPVSVLYVPKGPLLDDWADAHLRRQVLDDLAGFARRQGAIFLKIDPDVCLGTGVPGETDARDESAGQLVAQELQALGWQFSDEQIQFKNSMLIDLAQGEEALLAAMKQKTRYNLRLSERRGVQVSPASESDLPLLYRMYAETSLRDGFTIREEGYYLALWQSFMRAGARPNGPHAQPLIARVEGEPVAGMILFVFAGTAWFFYGMSTSMHREAMPNYLLQWQAIQWARAHGCSLYDMWGAPDVFNEEDAMYGVYRFKQGLGASVVRRLGAWDLPVSSLLYRLYQKWLPQVLDWMRRRGVSRTRRESQI